MNRDEARQLGRLLQKRFDVLVTNRHKGPVVPSSAGGQGYKDATRDPEALEHQLQYANQVGIGLVPHSGGMIVIDVDDSCKGDVNKSAPIGEANPCRYCKDGYGRPGQHGSDMLDELRQYGKISELAVVRNTKSGHRQIYFRSQDPNAYIGKSFYKGCVEFFGNVGYVIAPGTHFSDEERVWETGTFATADLFPDFLWQRLTIGTQVETESLDEDNFPIEYSDTLTTYQYLRDVCGGRNGVIKWKTKGGIRYPTIEVTSPSHAKGGSASIGDDIPGTVMFYTPNWYPPNTEHGKPFPLVRTANGNVEKFNLDELQSFVEFGVKKIDIRFDVDSDDWPVLRDDAFHGPVGQLVKLIAPTVEPDPAWLLTTLLSGMGTVIGKMPHYSAQAIRQGTNLFAVMVGHTASGKGTSWGFIEQVLQDVDSDFMSSTPLRVVSGFASGEVVVRTAANLGKTADGTVMTIGDGRMLIKEDELAKVLKTAQREGSILSYILNDAYDGRTLQYRAQKLDKGAIEAYNAHVGVVAHITPGELVHVLTSIEAVNGFANRFLWVLGKKTQHISTAVDEFGDYTEEELAHLTADDLTAAQRYTSKRPTYDVELYDKITSVLQDNLTKAKTRARVKLHPTVVDLHDQMVRELSENLPHGMVGPMVSRGRAHFSRLALIYALLDGSVFIQEPHLRAAKAVWDYCKASVDFLFGREDKVDVQDALVEKVYDRICSFGKEGVAYGSPRKWGFSNSNEGRRDEVLTTLGDRVRIVQAKQGKRVVATRHLED